ncbi:Riboflavin transporter [Alteripontixanthobacter maritimus]|uniref:Riboflavin transporter n=1 Tax=Alteripontixanthobacter maritimus TaxID=2161824 RepID=A0A369Q8E9_9SPHN|nr:DMT family transporter [Alteripontixanthobacter maritimus]RDC60752.1 Riboflavin transporter [Alteripontixanthobacter maritimus]
MLALGIRLAAIFVLSVMLVLVKLASEAGLHLAEILFWRQLPTIPMLLLWLGARRSLGLLRSRRMGKHALRAVIGLIGMGLNFGAVTLLPLAEATTFGFTSAIWAVVLSALILHEAVGRWRWSAVALGFTGVIVIAQPGLGGADAIPLFGALVSLGAAFMIALISILIRDLAATEHPVSIVFWFSAFSLPILLVPMMLTAQAATAYQWALLGGLAASGLAGQLLLTAALRFGAVSSVIVMDYSALLWATLFGWAVFDRLPVAAIWAGAPLIISAGLIIAWREHRLARERAGRAATALSV